MTSRLPSFSDNPFASLKVHKNQEDAKNSIITEDEVYSASDDINLLSSDEGGKRCTTTHASPVDAGSFEKETMVAELELTNSHLESPATVDVLTGDDHAMRFGGDKNARNCEDKDDPGDESDDDDDQWDESTFGINIDDEIVNNVLKSSEDRIRERENQAMRKFYKYAMIVFATFVIFIGMIDSDILMRRKINKYGSPYHYDDREKVPNRGGGAEDEEQMILDEKVDFGGAEYAKYFFKAASVLDSVFDPSASDVPFLFRMPSVCYTLEDTFSQCLGLIIASGKPGPPELPDDEVSVRRCKVIWSLLLSCNILKFK